MNSEALSVSAFLGICNDALSCTFPEPVLVVGEVSSFKVSQGKWVFYDLKDETGVLNCFMPIWNLRMPLEDGMRVIVQGVPKISSKWGKFSLTVSRVMPVGEGNIKKSFELLKKKLSAEGLFDPAKKRSLPHPLQKIGVISSTEAAGYADFIKILGERWGGLKLQVAHTQVQGISAADQIIRALKYFNERGEVQVIAILRGGGSADDLSVFNDEKLVRAIAASKIPVLTGIGHEVDESLSDLAADIRASTPSNAAQMLTRDRKQEIASLHVKIESLRALLLTTIDRSSSTELLTPVKNLLINKISQLESTLEYNFERLHRQTVVKITTLLQHISSQQKILAALNPDKVLSQGYAILRGKISPGESLEITTINQIIETEVKNVKSRH